MYVRHFKEDRVAVLHDATKIWLRHLGDIGRAGLEASHLPMLLDPSRRHSARCSGIWRAPIRSGAREARH